MSFVAPRPSWDPQDGLSFTAPRSELWSLFLFLLRLTRGSPVLLTFSSPDNQPLAAWRFSDDFLTLMSWISVLAATICVLALASALGRLVLSEPEGGSLGCGSSVASTLTHADTTDAL